MKRGPHVCIESLSGRLWYNCKIEFLKYAKPSYILITTFISFGFMELNSKSWFQFALLDSICGTWTEEVEISCHLMESQWKKLELRDLHP